MRAKKIIKCAAAAGLIALLLCGLLWAASAENYRERRQGMKGDDVYRFKVALYWLGYFNSDDFSDAYTKTTAERVKLLQKNNGLKQTGVANAALQELVFSGNAVPTDTAPSPPPLPAPPLAPPLKGGGGPLKGEAPPAPLKGEDPPAPLKGGNIPFRGWERLTGCP